MTQAQQDQLNQLQAAVTAAQNALAAENQDYTNFKNNWIAAGNTPGGIVNGHNNQYWSIMMNGSAASMQTKQTNLDNATLRLNNFLANISAQDAADFQKNNPQVFENIQKAQIQAQADIQKNADSKKLMQGTTVYLIIGGIVLVLIVGGVIIYRKKFMNK